MTNFTKYTSSTISAHNWNYIARDTSIGDNAITVNGNDNNVSVNRPLIVNDRNILKELDEMRDALLLLKRDVDMEAKYPRLKELKDRYEAELEKYKTYDRIKKSKR
jgi:hypothetical protein